MNRDELEKKNSVSFSTRKTRYVPPFVFLVAVLIPFSYCVGNQDNSWPKFQRDIQNSGCLNSTIPSSVRQKWNFTTLGIGAINFPPVMSDGTIFFGSEDGNFYALNETNGNILWVRQIGACSASPAVDSSRKLVFVAEYTKGSIIYAMDEYTGETKWEKQADFGPNYPIDDEDLNRPWYAPPTIDYQRGLVYFGGMNYWVDPPDPYYYWARRADSLYCLNEVDGSVVWKAGGSYANKPLMPLPLIYTCPAIEDGRLFYGHDGINTGTSTTGVPLISPPNICAVNQSDGSSLWQRDLGTWGGGYIRSSPALAFEKVFIGSSDKNLYALDQSSGQISWQYTTGGAVESSPAIDNSKGIICVGSDDGNLYCFSKFGAPIWIKAFGSPVKSNPIIADSKVLISTGNKLSALNESSGEEIWSFSSSGAFTSPITSGGAIFVGSAEGRLYALFTTTKISTSLSDPTTMATFNQTCHVSTRLLDESSHPISNAEVSFSLFKDAAWKQIDVQSTNSQGDVATTYRPDLQPGTYGLKVDFLGDFFYENCSFVGQIIVTRALTSLSFLDSPFEVNYSSTIKLVTQIRDVANIPIDGLPVKYQLQVAAQWIDLGINTTDINGLAELDYRATALPSVYVLRATFDGNTYYENQTCESLIQIDKGIAMISDPSTSAVFGENTLIQTRLFGSTNSSISGCVITFWLRPNNTWSQIGSSMTNINGYAVISFLANLQIGKYEMQATFNGNDYYWSQYTIGILSINSRILVDQGLVSSNRADVGSVQRILFHSSWQSSGSSLNSGYMSINGSKVAINSTGWAEILVSSHKAILDKWLVTSVDCNGATVFLQEVPDPDIIWDEILVTLSTDSERVEVGKTISIEIDARYAYDGQTFLGMVYLNDSSCRLADLGQKHYSVEQVTDSLRGLTSFKSNILSVVWDMVNVTLKSIKHRANIGEAISIIIDACYAYDNAPFVGRIVLNDSATSSDVVGQKSYKVQEVLDSTYNISVFKSNILSVVWDKIEVTLNVTRDRVDVGSSASISMNAIYSFDKRPFDGVVSLNDTSFTSLVPTQKYYTISQISGSSEGITSFASNAVSIIWDEIIIDLSTSKQRAQVGENVTIHWSARYAFDGKPFTGEIFLNDTTQRLFSIGERSYEVANVSDGSDLGLTRFHCNTVTVVWDTIRIDYSVENPTLGVLDVKVWLYSVHYDDPVKDAYVTLDGAEAISRGDGSYYCRMLTWAPFLSADIKVYIGNDLQLQDQKILGLVSLNFAVELVALPVIVAVILVPLGYMKNKKRKTLIARAKELDPKIVNVAVEWGGLVTPNIIVHALGTQLEVAQECLERFVKQRAATKSITGNSVIYDFHSVRERIAKVDQKIYSALRQIPSGLHEEEIMDNTGLASDVIKKTLNEMELKGKVIYDRITSKYRLRVFENSWS